MNPAAVFAVLTIATQMAPPSRALVPPNGTLSVAYRQLTQGKLSESVHQTELQCWDGHCSLTVLTLNQCMESSAGPAFYPKVQRSSTDEGDLVITRVESGVVEAEQTLDGARFLYRFSHRERSDPAVGQRGTLRSPRLFGQLTGFSGSVVKSSDVLGKVLSWDLVPLKGASAFVEAGCKIMLDGVPE